MHGAGVEGKAKTLYIFLNYSATSSGRFLFSSFAIYLMTNQKSFVGREHGGATQCRFKGIAYRFFRLTPVTFFVACFAVFLYFCFTFLFSLLFFFRHKLKGRFKLVERSHSLCGSFLKKAVYLKVFPTLEQGSFPARISERFKFVLTNCHRVITLRRTSVSEPFSERFFHCASSVSFILRRYRGRTLGTPSNCNFSSFSIVGAHLRN